MSNEKLTKEKSQKPSGGKRLGGPPSGGTVEKAKDFKGSMGKLIKYIANYKLALVMVVLCTLASTVFAIVSPKILGEITTEIFAGAMSQIQGGDGINFDLIGKIALALIAIYLFSAGFALVQGLLMSKISVKVTYKLRNEIEDKIHRLPISYYDKNSTGDVLSRITNDVDVINQILSQGLAQIISSVATLAGIIIMMLSINWQMALITIATLPISGLIVAFIVKRSQKYFDKQQEYIGKINGKVEESYGAHTVIKAFNGEEKTIEAFETQNKVLYKSAWKANFLSGLMMPVLVFVGNLGYVAVCILGGYLVSGGVIKVGDIQAFLQYTRQFSQPLAQVSQISAVLQQTASASERIFALLEEEDEVEEKVDPNIKLENITGVVDFNNVNFGYVPGQTIINDFTCHVTQGQKVAIVGPTGAGKTTIVKLLMRFYPLNGGSINLDGYDIDQYKKEDLREMFGMVLQDTWLYNSTIMENIRYGRLTATDEEVIAAAKAAQADKFISSLPNGYEMELNEDATNLSQGQKQLLTIARAILANHKVLILDEATSSVDTRTEVLIQKAMDNLMEGRTSFIIAHRLSTIKNADVILVMDKGDVIEQGSHDELMLKDGFYAGLYRSQFE